IAPDQYSLSEPEAVKLIYGLRRTFPKAAWYDASSNPHAEYEGLFTDRNTTRHASHRRLVANLYSVTALRSMEDSVDECIGLYQERLDELAASGKPFDLQFWMQSYAFDVISQITVPKRLGLLEKGVDEQNIFSSLDSYLKYCALVGIFPGLHKSLFWLMAKLSTSGMMHVAQFTREQIQVAMKTCSGKRVQDGSASFLSKTMEIHERDSERFPLNAAYITCFTNIAAGSDTTSISLCSIMHNLINHPQSLMKLREEVDEKFRNLGDSKFMPFQDARSMPYLQACIKEGLRIHPATGLPLVRLVPEGGATISGRFFPAGTTVGVNTWVAHRNKSVFGADAAIFRPERWLEASPEQLSLMNSCFMPFGAGSRTCIGKHISLMEMNKLVPTLVERYDFTAFRPERVKYQNYWFVKPQDMYCTVALRQRR
ncbi:cytochrome P450, partial [Dactylonectria macrodidyma]